MNAGDQGILTLMGATDEGQLYVELHIYVEVCWISLAEEFDLVLILFRMLTTII